MDELLARVMQGVDPAAPGAFWVVFGRLMALVPWWQLTLWSLLFVAVGAALGARRGRLRDGVFWSVLLGPIGWIIVCMPRRRRPPPLPRRPH